MKKFFKQREFTPLEQIGFFEDIFFDHGQNDDKTKVIRTDVKVKNVCGWAIALVIVIVVFALGA